MLKKYYKDSDCPIAATIDVIGGKWKPIIIWLLMQEGTMRFGEIHQSVPGITLKVLARQLKDLESHKIISRKSYPEVPPRVEYSLTEKGRTLIPLMQSLACWSEENILPKVGVVTT